jgi:hypothetical protein
LVEQRIENPRVDGSIPSQATKQKPLLSQESSGFFFAGITMRCSSRLPNQSLGSG